MDTFLGLIQTEMERFEQRLDHALRSDVELAHEVARYMSTVKGKRLRPALAVMCAKAAGICDDRIIQGGVVVEMIHAATMIHDDVIDSAATRRGKPSVNATWSDQIAVLMGDFLLSRALCILVGLGNLRALDTVSHATERLSQGELFEIQIGQQTDTSESSYFAMVGDKTASLVAASCQIGPILGGASDEVIEAMGRYGESLGRAFQIADDILDFTGDANTMGKPVGLDLREDKITLPLILALQAAPAAQRDELHQLLSNGSRNDPECQRIVEFVERFDGVAAAGAMAVEHGTRAQACLAVLPESPARAALELAVQLVVERNN